LGEEDKQQPLPSPAKVGVKHLKTWATSPNKSIGNITRSFLKALVIEKVRAKGKKKKVAASVNSLGHPEERVTSAGNFEG